MSKSLKVRNRARIWAVILANLVAFSSAIGIDHLEDGVASAAKQLPSITAALVVAAVFNGLLSADMKARLVFLRWRNALPGHRAFSKYAGADPRVDVKRLANIGGARLPRNPVEQNRLWYRFYKSVEGAPAVEQVHQDFLLMRDYASLSLLFLLFLGGLAAYILGPRSAALYGSALLIQFILVRQAASNYGIRWSRQYLPSCQRQTVPCELLAWNDAMTSDGLSNSGLHLTG